MLLLLFQLCLWRAAELACRSYILTRPSRCVRRVVVGPIFFVKGNINGELRLLVDLRLFYIHYMFGDKFVKE
jgi:hypothetical protein